MIDRNVPTGARQRTMELFGIDTNVTRIWRFFGFFYSLVAKRENGGYIGTCTSLGGEIAVAQKQVFRVLCVLVG